MSDVDHEPEPDEPVVLPALPELRDDGAIGLEDALADDAAGADDTAEEPLDLDDPAAALELEHTVTDDAASWLRAEEDDTLDVGVTIDPLDDDGSAVDERPADLGLELEVADLPAMLGDGGDEGPVDAPRPVDADDDAPPAGLPPIARPAH